MSPTPPDHDQVLQAIVAGVAAELFPDLSADDRRARMLRALGLEPLAPWGGRMVYVEARRG